MEKASVRLSRIWNCGVLGGVDLHCVDRLWRC